MKQFKSVGLEGVEKVKEAAQILLVTATNVETAAVHSHMRPLRPRAQCLQIRAGNQTYYIGRLGSYGVIHVQSGMGSVLPGASGGTVAEAIAFWKVRAVVMVGRAEAALLYFERTFYLGASYLQLGDILASRKQFEETLTMPKKNITYFNAIINLGAGYSAEKNFAKAIAITEEALSEARKSSLSEEDRTKIITLALFGLARAHSETGDNIKFSAT